MSFSPLFINAFIDSEALLLKTRRDFYNNLHLMTENRDFIGVNDLEVACRIGDTPEERAFPHIVFLSLRLYLPLRKAGLSDDLKDTVDYAKVIKEVRALLETKSFDLVEAAAESVATLILKNHPVKKIDVHMTKKVFPGVGSFETYISRTRS